MTNLPLHHLPGRRDNVSYIAMVGLSPLINLAVSGTIFGVSEQRSALHREMFGQHWIFALSEFVIAGVGMVLFFNLLINLLRRHRHIRRALAVLGVLSTLDLLLNIVTLIYGMYHFKIDSYVLLIICCGLYVSLNLVFVFWYWYVDYPTQVRRIHEPASVCEIGFPRSVPGQRDRWLPTLIDYLYFTLMTSNTLGPPENHSPSGGRLKSLQLVQSTLMLFLLVIFVSRAVNTLS